MGRGIERQGQQWPQRVAAIHAVSSRAEAAHTALRLRIAEISSAQKAQRQHWPGLVNTIREIGGRWRENPVTLADGSQTNIYLDLKSVLSNGHRNNQASHAMLEHLNELGIDYNAVGGPTMGADMVSHGMAAHNPDLDWFAVRSAPKTTHGLGKWIEGAELGPQHKVILTDDVANTGKSLVDAYHKIRESGAQVAAVVPIVDRGDRTRNQFQALGVPYHPLMSYDDLGINTLSQPQPPSQQVQARRDRYLSRVAGLTRRQTLEYLGQELIPDAIRFRCRIAMPQPINLALSNEQPDYTGSHGMQVMSDEQGDWSFKQPKDSLSFLVPLETAAANLQRQMGLEAPETYAISHQGRPAVVSKWYPGSSQAWHKPPRLSQLSPDDQMAIQKNHVLDWLIGNHDSHVGNWMRTQDGKLVSIDKGQAAKYFGHDRLDPHFHPNYYAREPIYNQLYRDHAAGLGQLHDPRTGELGEFVHQVQSIPDEHLKAMFRPYAESAARSGLLLNPDGDPSRGLGPRTVPANSPEHFLDALVARKNNLHNDLGDYHDRMSADPRQLLGARVIPTAKGPRRVYNATDIATALGVAQSTMANWMRKHPDRVPSPTHAIGGQAHWDNLDPWHQWARTRPGPGRPRKVTSPTVDPAAAITSMDTLDGPGNGQVPRSSVAPLGVPNTLSRPQPKINTDTYELPFEDFDFYDDNKELLRSLHARPGPGEGGNILPRNARRRR